MKSTSSAVKSLVRHHMLEGYTLEELKENINNIKCGAQATNYRCASYVVETGCFMIYNDDIEKWLQSLDITNVSIYKGKKAFDYYRNLLATQINRMLLEEEKEIAI